MAALKRMIRGEGPEDSDDEEESDEDDEMSGSDDDDLVSDSSCEISMTSKPFENDVEEGSNKGGSDEMRGEEQLGRQRLVRGSESYPVKCSIS